ncbi:MAG: ubiquinol-cytochrome c reductase iron-sulfur subunit [candidate division NC10 bacterium]|nr:ubiquinol-cytochrome c reductase iron-sulfur subunit [candidate division NC10 bacterium]
MPKPGFPSESTGPNEGRVSRRALLGTGWCGFLLSIVGPAVANIRFLFPNVVYEGPTLLKVGRPEDYAPGTIAFLEEQRLFIIRDPEGFRALSAICTHLRCTTGPYVPPDAEWKASHSHCPCHGSVFAKDGRVLQGPAPRPLDFYRVSLAPDGRLVVDTATVVGKGDVLKV